MQLNFSCKYALYSDEWLIGWLHDVIVRNEDTRVVRESPRQQITRADHFGTIKQATNRFLIRNFTILIAS